MKATLSFVTSALLLLLGSPAHGYPTSVVFAPTGDSRDLGQIGAFAYGAMSYQAKNANAWVGVGAGLVPSFAYGGGLRFGGVEVGANLLTPDLRGASRVLPLFDLKASVLAEGRYHPALAAGVIGLSPTFKQQLNFGYVAVTKTLKWQATSYGRVTLGAGHAFVPDAQLYPGCKASGDPCAFRGSVPFEDVNVSPMLGYETPGFGRFSFAVDHVGGTSVLSATNVVANVLLVEGFTFSLGAWFSNDRRVDLTGAPAADGLFALLSVLVDFRKTPAAPAAPTAAPGAPGPRR